MVPSEQTFEAPYYNGLFRFRFWQFGQWYEVVVDDYLVCVVACCVVLTVTDQARRF